MGVIRREFSGSDQQNSAFTTNIINCGESSHLLPIFTLSGTPYEIGRSYGEQDRENIQRVLDHHAAISGKPGSKLVDVSMLEIDCETFWGSDGLAELRGIAEGAEVPLENLIYHNLQIYAVGACSHFAGQFTSSGRFYHGANIDVPAKLILRDSLTFHLQRRCPKGGIPYVIPGMAGLLGGIGGLNANGLFLSSSMLVEIPQPKCLAGTVHGIIVSRLLESCRTLDEAARFLSVAAGWGGWAVAVSSPKDKRVVYAEYAGDQVKLEIKKNRFICSNHSQLFSKPTAKIPDHTKVRLNRLEALLEPDESRSAFKTTVDPEKILFDRYNPIKQTVSRFRTMSSIFRVDHAVTLVINDRGKCSIALSHDAELGHFTAEIGL